MQRAYGSEVPHRQFGGRTAEGNLILNQAQDSILHQLLGIGTGFCGKLGKLRFLLGREMYFHALQGTRKPGVRQHRKHKRRKIRTLADSPALAGRSGLAKPLLAMAWYFASSSMPIYVRPSIFAASSDEPEPVNGSSTTPPRRRMSPRAAGARGGASASGAACCRCTSSRSRRRWCRRLLRIALREQVSAFVLVAEKFAAVRCSASER